MGTVISSLIAQDYTHEAQRWLVLLELQMTNEQMKGKKKERGVKEGRKKEGRWEKGKKNLISCHVYLEYLEYL